jgi:hypothetical protein
LLWIKLSGVPSSGVDEDDVPKIAPRRIYSKRNDRSFKDIWLRVNSTHHRVNSAHEILDVLMDTPDKGIPLDIAAKAQCIAVVPNFKKVPLLSAPNMARVLLPAARNVGGVHRFIQLEGASFGFQIGGQSTDLVLVGVFHHSLDDLLRAKVIWAATLPCPRSRSAVTPGCDY